MTETDIVARHLARLRAGAFDRAVTIDTPYGKLQIEAADSAPINRAIEHVLERLVRRAKRSP